MAAGLAGKASNRSSPPASSEGRHLLVLIVSVMLSCRSRGSAPSTASPRLLYRRVEVSCTTSGRCSQASSIPMQPGWMRRDMLTMPSFAPVEPLEVRTRR